MSFQIFFLPVMNEEEYSGKLRKFQNHINILIKFYATLKSSSKSGEKKTCERGMPHLPV